MPRRAISCLVLVLAVSLVSLVSVGCGDGTGVSAPEERVGSASAALDLECSPMSLSWGGRCVSDGRAQSQAAYNCAGTVTAFAGDEACGPGVSLTATFQCCPSPPPPPPPSPSPSPYRAG
jgi:hypothetical protein